MAGTSASTTSKSAGTSNIDGCSHVTDERGPSSSRSTRETRIPAARLTKSAGIWANRPSPMVSRP